MKRKQTKTIKWERFNVEGGWTSWDRLGEKRLESGERLMISWPDGTDEEVRIIVRETCVEVLEMGHPAQEWHHRAYAKIKYRGVSIEVRLTDVGRFISGLRKKEYDDCFKRHS